MSLIAMLLVAAVYIVLGAYALHMLFPATQRGMLMVMMGICYFMAFFGVLINGIMPPIPLTPGSYWSFTIVFYLGLTVVTTFGIKWTLENPPMDFPQAAIISAGLNLVLMIPLSFPTFYAALVSNFLLKTST